MFISHTNDEYIILYFYDTDEIAENKCMFYVLFLLHPKSKFFYHICFYY
jgi:hypothetical protein